MLAAPAWAFAAGPAAAVPVPACQLAGPCVVVQVLDGDQVTSTSYFYADEVIAGGDVPRTSYPVYGGVDAVVEKGSSIGRLVGLAVADPGTVRFVEVVAPPPDRFGRHLLTAQELSATDNGFEGGLLPAFYSTEPSGAERVFSYVRPQRDPNDDNGSPGPDQGRLNGDFDGALLVRAHLTGEILDVTVTATPVGAGDRSFALAADPSGPGYSYDWRLPGSSGSNEAAPTYTFPDNAAGGTYDATVGLERLADGSFGWGRVPLQVGPAPTPTPSPSPTSKPGTGGDGPGGQGPTKAPSGSPSAEPQPDPDPGGGGEPTFEPTLPPPSTPTFPTTGPEPAPTEPVPTPTEPAGPAPSGAEVTGILLTGAQSQDGSVVADAPQPSEAARPLTDAPVRVGTAVWATAVALLLLLAGASSESARVRRWWRRRWPMMSP